MSVRLIIQIQDGKQISPNDVVGFTAYETYDIECPELEETLNQKHPVAMVIGATLDTYGDGANQSPPGGSDA